MSSRPRAGMQTRCPGVFAWRQRGHGHTPLTAQQTAAAEGGGRRARRYGGDGTEGCGDGMQANSQPGLSAPQTLVASQAALPGQWLVHGRGRTPCGLSCCAAGRILWVALYSAKLRKRALGWMSKMACHPCSPYVNREFSESGTALGAQGKGLSPPALRSAHPSPPRGACCPVMSLSRRHVAPLSHQAVAGCANVTTDEKRGGGASSL